MALSSYPVAVERSFATRAQAVSRTLATLRFLWNAPQGPMSDATGHRGFFYHFLDLSSGRRAWRSELSTLDTAILMAGALTAAAYFDRNTAAEREVRSLADALYQRVDWRWAQNGGAAVSHGWKPETGFLRYRWKGYNEALLLYVLGLGSPTHPLSANSYRAWTSTYRWRTLYGYEFLYGAALFMHQLSQQWIDFRGIQDAFMRVHAIDYFENSRRATYVNRQYAIRNPKRFRGYGPNTLGDHGEQRSRSGHAPSRWRNTAFLRIHFARRAVWARRRHVGPVGGCRLIAVRAGDRASHAASLYSRVSEDGQRIRPRLQFQSDVSEPSQGSIRLDLAKPLRTRSGAGHSDDREPSL